MPRVEKRVIWISHVAAVTLAVRDLRETLANLESSSLHSSKAGNYFILEVVCIEYRNWLREVTVISYVTNHKVACHNHNAIT